MPNDDGRPQAEGPEAGPAEDAAENREDAAASDEAEALREISEDELEAILAEHKKWVETDGKEGQRANLVIANLRKAVLFHANLQGADLGRANLQGANLWGANLQEATLDSANLQEAILNNANLLGAFLVNANLQGANLNGANLQGANLQNADLETPKQNKDLPESDDQAGSEQTGDAEVQPANLRRADLRDANLSDAKLSTVTGLQSGQLGGADLSNAKLPEDIAKFEGLAHVTEISKHARNIFLAVVGGCVFSWLTIATTTDVALLTNSGSSPLPIIQTKVPIAGFYWAAPAILLALYVYLHLYLQRLWSGLASLPAIFPDGRTLVERAYPWLLTSLVNAHVPRLKDKPQARLGLQVAVSLVAAWMFVPGTLGLFWLRYLPRHDWPWTLWLVALFVVAIAFGTASYRLATTTLRGEPTTKPDAESEDKATTPTWKRALRAVLGYRPDRYSATAAILGLLILLGAIEGRPASMLWPTYYDVRDVRTWVYALVGIADYYPALQIEAEDVSIKPENWKGLGKKPNELSPTDLAEVKGAQLADRDLKNARAFGAFFLKANLGGANLQGADLRGANLQGANLFQANLQRADLRNANLKGAFLRFANLQETLFGDRFFVGKANLAGADLRFATGLTQAQLDESCGDDKTKLSGGLTIEHCPDETENPD